MQEQKTILKVKPFLAQWIDIDGKEYHRLEIEAVDLTQAVARATEYAEQSGGLLFASDLVVQGQ